MAHNICYQMTSKLEFAEGVQKHTYKIENGYEMSDKIFSWSERNNLKDVCNNFSNFLKENHPDVKKLSQVTQKHCVEFLCKKAEACTSSTLKSYSKALEKLGKIFSKAYKSVNAESWKVNPPIKEKTKLRSIAFDRDDFKKIMANSNDCLSRRALDICGRLGLRVSEVTNIRSKDIDEKRMTLHIHRSKGGLSRDISINKSDLTILKEYAKGKAADQRIIPITNNAVDRFLRVQCNLNGLTKYAEAKTGVHAIRKMVAQELYDKLRNEGKTKQEAREVVTKFLGHGANRKDVARVYIANQW